MSDLYKAIDEIKTLAHNRTVTCPKCSSLQEIQRLEIYADCLKCQTHFKIRAFSANIEIEDVIAESLVWLIRDDRFDEIAEKFKKIVAEEDK